MTLQRFIFKTHKWLAAGVSLFTVLWFFSGIVMIMPLLPPAARSAISSANSIPQGDSAPFRQMAVSVPQAITAAENAAGVPLHIERVALRTVAGKLIYEIGTAGGGTFLIDAMDATRLAVNEDLARQIATLAHKGPIKYSSIALVGEHTNEYKHGPLPVYRLAANDPRATLYFINADTGEMAASSTRLGRLRMKIVEVHTFAFLLPELAPRTVNTLVAFFGAVGLLMTLFGGGILVLQFRSWLVKRRRVA